MALLARMPRLDSIGGLSTVGTQKNIAPVVEVYYRVSVMGEDGIFYVRHAGLKNSTALELKKLYRSYGQHAVVRRCDARGNYEQKEHRDSEV